MEVSREETSSLQEQQSYRDRMGAWHGPQLTSHRKRWGCTNSGWARRPHKAARFQSPVQQKGGTVQGSMERRQGRSQSVQDEDFHFVSKTTLQRGGRGFEQGLGRSLCCSFSTPELPVYEEGTVCRGSVQAGEPASSLSEPSAAPRGPSQGGRAGGVSTGGMCNYQDEASSVPRG